MVRDFARNQFRRLLWPSPLCYAPVARLLYDQKVFTYNYDLLIDGFPRCANTFVLHLARTLYPTLRVRSHLHCPTFAIASVKQGTPVVVVIRDPIDAVPSWVVHHGCTLRDSLNHYIAYYTALVPYIDNINVITFNDATQNIERAVYSLSIATGIQPPLINEAELCATVQMSVAEEQQAMAVAQASYPHPARSRMTAPVRSELNNRRYAEQLARAKRLFAEFCVRSPGQNKRPRHETN